MSLGYAERLSFREDLGGRLGAPELSEASPEALEAKIQQLALWVEEASYIVTFTGAGISTSCGIPDFRGPSGVWTLQRKNKPLPTPKTSFTHAVPSLTHQVLADLTARGKLKYIVSQNVDGLHLRSGIPRKQLAELHGNCFAERCPRCSKEFVRDFEMQTVGFKSTGRRCDDPCGGRLRDSILDWEDALPEDELQASELHAGRADLAICLGTSLQITPACDIPLLTKKAGGRLVIVNLQKTPKDRHAALVMHARCDQVMAGVMRHLRWPIPPYIRTDAIVIRHTQARSHSGQVQFCVEAVSVHGHRCPLPMVAAAALSFPGEPGLRGVTRRPPVSAVRTAKQPGVVMVQCRLSLAANPSAMPGIQTQQEATLDYTAHLVDQAQVDAAVGGTAALPCPQMRIVGDRVEGQQEYRFETQRVEYSGQGRAEAPQHDKQGRASEAESEQTRKRVKVSPHLQ